MSRWPVLACILLALSGPRALSMPAHAEDSVRLGTLSPTNREWSRAEVRSTFDLWVKELAARFQVPVTISYYEDIDELRRDFLSGKINGVNTEAMTLVRHFKQDELAEGFATVMKGGWDLKLYAGQNVTIRDLADLAGKRIVLLDGGDIGDLYLETLCLRHHERPCKEVFADIQRASSNNQALMRVFFGKADLALVHGFGYDVSVEMNPQLARALKLVVQYPLHSGYYAFFSPDTDKAFRQRTLKIVPTLHTYPRGRQLLDIFKMERLEITTPAELMPFLRLEQEYQSLKALQTRPPRKEARK